MIIRNTKLYYFLRFISWVVIPVFSAFWYILSGILHSHTPSPVVGVVIGIDAYLGITLQIYAAKYQNQQQRQAGHIIMEETPEKRTYSLELDVDPEDFNYSDELVFKVRRPDA